MSVIDITCGDCGARFRLDRALLKDSSAARIRCRKCGGRIVVRLHEESPVPVLPPQEMHIRGLTIPYPPGYPGRYIPGWKICSLRPTRRLVRIGFPHLPRSTPQGRISRRRQL